MDMMIEEAQLPEGQIPETGAAPVNVHANPASRLPWENYLRCLFLMIIVFVIGTIMWRHGKLRFSFLLSLANPSKGERLAWRASEEPPPPIPEIKRVKPPDEWRPDSDHAALWNWQKPTPGLATRSPAKVADVLWSRYSDNPLNWSDDQRRKHRTGDDDQAAQQPPQKPASNFRVGYITAFPEAPLAPLTFNGVAVAPFSDELELPQFPFTTPNNLTFMESPSFKPETPSAQPPANHFQASAPQTPPVPAPGRPEATDWFNREITGPIPDAFLTIYPKLKFIGLCVPDQGYIRKYHQVGVPADLINPKMNARDGRTPYGMYYIADRHRDIDGPRLFLSWPSPEDARRIGLDANHISQIDNAWHRHELPPQNTAAGGGVGFTGLRNWVETTEGGFTLEEPHMEEIFTAMPNGGWVFVQP